MNSVYNMHGGAVVVKRMCDIVMSSGLLVENLSLAESSVGSMCVIDHVRDQLLQSKNARKV